MRKFLPLVFGLFFGYATIFAQANLNIIRVGGNHSVNDSVILKNGTTADSLITLALDVINTDSISQGIKVTRTDSVNVTGSSNYLSWGSSFSPQVAPVWTAPSTENILAHDTDKTFTGDYQCHGHAGTEIIKYCFFNAGNPNLKTCVILEISIVPAGINEVAKDNLHLSNLYPNPANSTVVFNYHLYGVQQAKLSIYNTTGQYMQTIPVNSSMDKLYLDISAFPSGIYICKLEAKDSQPVFQKLIITH